MSKIQLGGDTNPLVPPGTIKISAQGTTGTLGPGAVIELNGATGVISIYGSDIKIGVVSLKDYINNIVNTAIQNHTHAYLSGPTGTPLNTTKAGQDVTASPYNPSGTSSPPTGIPLVVTPLVVVPKPEPELDPLI